MRGTSGCCEGRPAASEERVQCPSAMPAPRSLPSWPGMTNPELAHVSTNRRRVLDPPLGPQAVETAADAELRAWPDVAVEALAVVADLLDDAHHPVLGQAELLAVGAFGADEPPDLRLGRFQRLIDILGGDAELLGVDHREVHPLDDVEPLIVAVPHRRSKRLLRDDL